MGTKTRCQLKLLWWSLICALVAACSTEMGPKDGLELSSHDLDRVKVGDGAPDFTLENVDGNRITLSSFRGKSDVVLIFYRGHW